ncbi:MAG: hypothetical protein K6F30_10325 [Lachnospiraceae bacterium]|nr:hypothetical protein [Lachnospiraceae bacterium]
MISQKEYEELCKTIRELCQSGYEVMLFHQGFGETAIFLQVVYKYKELSGKKLFIITYTSTRTEILKCSDVIDEVFEVPKDVYLMLSGENQMLNELGIKNFLAMHNMDLDRSTMKNEVCEFLGIPKDTPYRHLSLPGIQANWDEYFRTKNLLPGKTVYIVPHALFLGKVVPEEFWEKLVERLREEGYTAIMNLPSETIPGVPFAYFDMVVSLQLAKHCGCVVGARTGFMDLVATFTDLPIIAIYPDDTHPSWDICKKYTWREPVNGDYAKVYMESTGINTLFPRDGITELVYTSDEEIIDEIIEKISFKISY